MALGFPEQLDVLAFLLGGWRTASARARLSTGRRWSRWPNREASAIDALDAADEGLRRRTGTATRWCSRPRKRLIGNCGLLIDIDTTSSHSETSHRLQQIFTTFLTEEENVLTILRRRPSPV